MTFKLKYLKSEDITLIEPINQLTFETSNIDKGTIYRFTRLLIRDRKEGYSIYF